MVNKIIITGDIFRPTCHSNGHIEGSQNWNINNRYLLFKHLFKSITSLPVEKCYWDSEMSFDSSYFYQLLNYPIVSQSSWFSIYEKENLPQEAESYLLKFFQNAFIVGFELPPILCGFFIRNNISYISLIDYPIRFLDDTISGLSTNVEDIFTILKTYQIDAEGFYMHAALAKIRLSGANIIEKDSAVFFGQTAVDLSLYKDGKCLKVLDFEKEIIAIAKSHKKLYFKMHPYAEAVSEPLDSFMKAHNIELTTWNVYELLANENLKTAVAISSSVLEEAKYFDKDTVCLHAMPHRYASDNLSNDFDCSLNIPIGYDVLLPNFWLNIFKCIKLSKEVSFNNSLPFESNTFRYSTSAFWGYDKLYKPLVHLIHHNNPIRSDISRIKENCSCLSQNIDELRKINNSLSDEMNQLLEVGGALSHSLNELKEINDNLSIDMNRLKEDNNTLTVDIHEVKGIKDTVSLDIQRFNEIYLALNARFDEFENDCKKFYKRKLFPRLYSLLVRR